MAQLVDEIDPVAIVHLGLAGGRARLSLERIALNVMDYDTPDDAGHVARGEACVPDGPPADYLAPCRCWRDPRRGARPTASRHTVSNTAGTYLCNQTMYGTLPRAQCRGVIRPAAGFIHLPLLPAMVAASGLEQPSMDAALMVRAVEIALAVVARAR